MTKYTGLTNFNQFIEDLEAKFILQPIYHATDRQRVMIAVENLEGSSPDGDSEAPKDWARLEAQLSPDLKDDWPTFAQRLRDRYSNPTIKLLRIRQRQTLK
ncbi:hypothetical protein K3495_g15138 [Podosphaera aphanis]|nr:hypothetical protein K3495_g15138 [Podosphaera aphanis]